jgi:hypothetical protein
MYVRDIRSSRIIGFGCFLIVLNLFLVVLEVAYDKFRGRNKRKECFYREMPRVLAEYIV